MATRVYLESSGAAAFDTLAFSAYWDGVNSTHYHYASGTTKAGSTNTNREISWSTGKRANIQYITGQWSAFDFTTSHTIKFQIRANSDSGTGVTIAASIRVVSGDGSTVRGTLYEGAGPTSVPSASIINRALGSGGAAVSVQNNVSMSNGDRIAIELGHTSSGYSGSRSYPGSDSATDLPEDETTTTAYNAWCEFSPTLSAYSAGEVIGAAGSVASVSSVTGSIAALKTFSGSSASVSSVSGGALRNRAFYGSSSSVSSVSAGVLRGRVFAGTISSLSSMSGSWLRDRYVDGSVSAQSAVLGAASPTKVFSGTIAGVSTVTGKTYGLMVGKGTISAVSSLSAKVRADYELRGLIAAISSLTGLSSADIMMKGLISSVSTLIGVTGTGTVANKSIYVKVGGEWVEISPTASVVNDADGGTW